MGLSERFYIQHKSGRWHRWFKEAGTTACGKLNQDSLRKKPPVGVKSLLVPEDMASFCASCRKKEGGLPQTDDDSQTKAWAGYVRRHLKQQHLRASDRDVMAIARRLSSIGPPDNEKALDAWKQIRLVLLTPIVKRVKGKPRRVLRGLKDALALLPPGGPELAHVVGATRAWRRLMGQASAGRVRSDRIVANMLAVPDPEAYLAHLRDKGFTTLSSVFSHGVLERAKREPELRGVWSGNSEYWDKALSNLNIVTE